jgi:hypothetical protein
MDFLVVLFKNKEKRKIINKFKTEKKALAFFNKLVHTSNEVIFPKETENGFDCTYEISILEKKTKNYQPFYKKDEIGRRLKIELEDEDYQIKKIENYNIEELFLDYGINKKIDSNQFLKKYIENPGLKMISKLNNKIVVQNDEKINLFTFKSSNDSNRFMDCLERKVLELGRKDSLFIKDYSTIHRKYLYKLLTDYGFPKSYLQRYSTTFPSKK